MAPKASVTKAQQPEPQHSTPQDIGEADGEGEKMRDPAADAPPPPQPQPRSPPQNAPGNHLLNYAFSGQN